MTLRHTDKEYEAELTKLREQLLMMGARVEEMIASSIRALVDRDSELARRTIEADYEVNRLELETDDLCLRILARRQPVARDLRGITIALKLVTDLERIGDVCVNICERAIELNFEPPLKQFVELPQMAKTVQAMVHDALDAFVAGDAEKAQEVIHRDRTVDTFYSQMFREFLTYMMEDARNIYRAMRVQAVAKHLERIGDHATNLAEMVVFMVKGKDIRHTGRKRPKHLPHGIVFLCVKNAARSQMAEGWAKKILPPGIRIWSAGSDPADAVHPLAVRVMQEVGIDISGQKPKKISDVPLGDVDTVVSLCAEEVCAVLPGEQHRESWSLDDPAAPKGTEEDVLTAFRRTREELRSRIEKLVPKTPSLAPIE